MALIKGGFYLKARCIQFSDIANAPPHVREIWDWLLKEANHEDTKTCKRGSCIRSYKDIQEGLHWYVGWRKMAYSKDDCETAMKLLKKRTMVTTKKTTRGMLINIVNYDKYQTVSNYENHTSDHRRTTHEPQTYHTINKNDKNYKNERSNTEGGDSVPAEPPPMETPELLEPTPKEIAKQFFEDPSKQEEVIQWMLAKGVNEDTARKELDNFIGYWTELNSTGKKQRWQMEKTFEIQRRLRTWLERASKYNRSGGNKQMQWNIAQ